MKQCYRCKIEKPFTEYHKNTQRKDGYSNECKSCAATRSKISHASRSVEEKKQRIKKVKDWEHDNPKNKWLHWAIGRAKRRAAKRNLPFDLSTKAMIDKVPDSCPVFGTPFIFMGNVVCTDDSPSIDRIDPKKGYVMENIAIISVKANTIKNAYNSSDLMKVALWLENIENGKS